LNIGVSPAEIRTQLKILCDDLGFWEDSEMVVEEMAARLHHRLVQIHPFPNGNGRWARLITNIFLRKHGKEKVTWPEKTLQADSSFRKNYIEALQSADGGDFQALQEIHNQFARSR
jgi:fido (protein-threonine AMPylation protein)